MHARGDEQQEQAHLAVGMHSACVTLCLCVRALSCISCAKRARRLKIVLRSGNYVQAVIADSKCSVAKRRCHWQCYHDQALSISTACRAPRLRAGRSRCEKGLLKAFFYAIHRKIAWRRSCPVPCPARRASKRGPHPHPLPGLHVIFCLKLRGVGAKKIRLSDAL